MYEKQHDNCDGNWAYHCLRRNYNPVIGNDIKELYQEFESLALGQYDKGIADTNAEWLSVYLDISEHLKPMGTKTEFENGALISKQEQYSADLYVDLRTGTILDIYRDEEVDMELAYGEHTARLQLEVLVDHEEFVRNKTGYQPHRFAIHGPEDPQTGVPYPLTMLLEASAIKNLEATIQLCNNPPA
ncbi:MAG: hypothetical protein ACR2FM_05740 [Candidatus Saccharimonadales bacterium]